jgi:putative membrane protein
MWGSHEGMGWWMLIGSVWFVLFWTLATWFIVSLVSRQDAGRGERSHPETPRDEAPIEIVKRRYARGEISHEEYEQMRRELG